MVERWIPRLSVEVRIQVGYSFQVLQREESSCYYRRPDRHPDEIRSCTSSVANPPVEAEEEAALKAAESDLIRGLTRVSGNSVRSALRSKQTDDVPAK